jgi:DNA-directed RNA polymerase subunit F
MKGHSGKVPREGEEMSGEEKLMSIPEVKQVLEGVQGSRELSYEQKLALEHATYSSKTDPESAQKLVKELEKNERITDTIAYKIVEIWPSHADDVKAIFAKERFTLKEDEVDTILKLVSKYERKA